MEAVDDMVAHVRTEKTGRKQTQSLREHLVNVARLSSGFAGKLNLSEVGELLGLLHDAGKASMMFQNYILSSEGLKDPDSDEYLDAGVYRGKIDHSTAGAQYAYDSLANLGQQGALVGELLALCLASHHSGLIDTLSPDGEDSLGKRLSKSDEKTHKVEVFQKIEPEIKKRIDEILSAESFLSSVIGKLTAIEKTETTDTSKKFQRMLLVKFLFSCLLDADRLDSADFENPVASKLRLNTTYFPWEILISRLETNLLQMPQRNEVDGIRRSISDACLEGAQRGQGTYTLTVPTGGGKTLASLRFALHHAKNHNLDRIIYVIPYTSIIDQNADVVRRILEPDPLDEGRVVLEHHSNLVPEEDSWRRKLLSENWDAPVVFTTSVQFLETLFGSGTRNARRMHQMSQSVLIFDEAQTLPMNCVHLFNHAVNFLVEHAGSTAVLCTATQPLLERVSVEKGALRLSSETPELMPDARRLFSELRRVETFDQRKDGGWGLSEVAQLARVELQVTGSVLVIVNTKNSARELFRALKAMDLGIVELFHLSTSMCPAHRLEILSKVRTYLEPVTERQVICVSTQLIEAGVDVDFGTVIRFSAGLDSIAQAAGRCNRNGRRSQLGRVFVVNPSQENLNRLPSIQIGKEKAERVLREYKDSPERFGNDRLGPEVLEQYYQYYFWERAAEMAYPVKAQSLAGRVDTLLNLLSTNGSATSGILGDYYRQHKDFPRYKGHPRHFRQSFMAASKLFAVVDAPTQAILVPWGDGQSIIAALCASDSPETEYQLLRKAQRFSVNVFPYQIKELERQKELVSIGGSGLVALLGVTHYSNDFGLSDQQESLMDVELV